MKTSKRKKVACLAQKDAKQTTFFILDVSMHTKIAKSTKSDLLHLRCFYAHKIAKSTRRQALLLFRRFMPTKMLSFLFAYVRFVLFVPFFLLLLKCVFCFLCMRV